MQLSPTLSCFQLSARRIECKGLKHTTLSPVIPALGRLKQEDGCEFEASLGYTGLNKTTKQAIMIVVTVMKHRNAKTACVLSDMKQADTHPVSFA